MFFPLETLMGGPIHVDYNVLIHLKKLPTKLSNVDGLILSKRMRDFLVNALLGPKNNLVKLDDSNHIDVEENMINKFNDSNILLGSIVHNSPLNIRMNFGRI